MDADEQFPGVLKVLVGVGDAELDARALVGNAAVEDEERDVCGQDFRPVRLEDLSASEKSGPAR